MSLTLKLTLTTTAALRSLADLIDHNPAGFLLVSDAPPAASQTSNNKADIVREGQLATSGKDSGATTARSSRTAAAGHSQPGPSAAAPGKTGANSGATGKGADATSAAPTDDQPPFPYADLQKVVIALHKIDPSKTAELAAKYGVKTFKDLHHSKWAAAKVDVEAAALAAAAAADSEGGEVA